MATKKTTTGPAKRKAPTKNYRSADAAEGAAKRKAAARVKSTGQTASSSMDAVTRRYQPIQDGGRYSRLTGVDTNINGYRTVEDRKTAERVGGLTGYAARRSADRRASLQNKAITSGIMSMEARAYERKLSSAPKKKSSAQKKAATGKAQRSVKKI